MVTVLRVLVALWALVGFSQGCVRDLEHNSGGDGYRHQAAALSMEEWIVDDLDPSAGDRSDWWKVEPPVTGTLKVMVRLDDPDREIEVGIFGRTGAELARAVTRPDLDVLVIHARVVRPERKFIMLRGHGGGATGYSLKATLGSGDGGGPRPGF